MRASSFHNLLSDQDLNINDVPVNMNLPCVSVHGNKSTRKVLLGCVLLALFYITDNMGFPSVCSVLV